MIGLDQLKHWLGSINISLDGLILVRIGYYWLGLVNIDLDGLNPKKY